MRVLADFHHAGLLQSLILLFEKRLNYEVYRPIGTDWFTQGYWKVYDHPATVEQFLGIGGNTPDGTAKLNEVESHPTPDVYICHDIDSGTNNKAITLHGFFVNDFDIVIASIPAHVEPFKRLCELHPNKPKLIFQIGNAWTTEAAQAPNIMASAIINGVSPDVNFIQYHQEFDTNIFKPQKWTAQFGVHTENGDINFGEPKEVEVLPAKNIYSFVNCFNVAGHFAEDWQTFSEIEKSMQDWSFKAFGGQCRDGAIGPTSVLANKMCEAMFIWHTKAGGDGYGHVIHNAPAVGRPLIVRKQYYDGKLAEPLLIDGETCIAIDGLSYPQIINKIVHYSEPVRYKEMCQKAYERFKQIVDFDREQKQIEVFLSKLI